MKRDVIIIGAGHNGLACAASLARAGRSVLVLERRAVIGGLCVREEFRPGFHTHGLHHDTHRVSSELIRTLGLEAHGLRRTARDAQLAICPDGRRFQIDSQGLSGDDAAAEAYAAWQASIDAIRPFLREVVHTPATRLHPETARDLWGLAFAGLKLRRLGKQRMIELMRVTPDVIRRLAG